MDHFGFSQQNFAAKLDVAPATISSIFTGRTNPTNKLVQAIHKAFPTVDTNWLMFGEGEMMLTQEGAEMTQGEIEGESGVSVNASDTP
ncbi:MAG: XRE family transcriptional regulator, partial [Alloprevotella sp.]